jgi:hypothetical protein
VFTPQQVRDVSEWRAFVQQYRPRVCEPTLPHAEPPSAMQAAHVPLKQHPTSRNLLDDTVFV